MLTSSRRVKKGPLSAKRQRFMELRARGWSVRAAAREVGVSRSAATTPAIAGFDRSMRFCATRPSRRLAARSLRTCAKYPRRVDLSGWSSSARIACKANLCRLGRAANSASVRREAVTL
ncbi:hypothetical protein B5M45_30960 [Mycobacterium simiae]|uniref:Uncharacterized protein n=1 Tax=Mycobacterium simiae TaxID=1784 RepID=A0A1X0XI76_MYCSI|nr:hypothetical protein B5M45_30960 [Mycobacterium simiae]